MSRKPLPNVDEKLIAMAIQVGGVNNANVNISTKTLAAMVGISEFTLFQHFKTKEALIEAAVLSLGDSYFVEIKKLSLLHLYDFSGFTLSVFDFFLAHRVETLFICNYSHATNRRSEELAAYYDTYLTFFKSHLDVFKPFFHSEDPTTALLLGTTFIRRLLYDAQFVLSGLIQDSPAYRAAIVQGLDSGILSLMGVDA